MIKTQLTIRKNPSPAGVVSEIRIPIILGTSVAALGKDQEITRYVQEETLAAIPRVHDKELMRFRLRTEPGDAQSLTPYFRDNTGAVSNSYLAAGFATNQIRTMSQGLARSMYILELYNTQDTDDQVLLSRSFTKGDDKDTYKTVSTTGGTVNTPSLQLVSSSGVATSISPIALPMYHVTANPEGTVYMLISFFNGSTGKKTRLRRRQTGLSIADNRYIPLTYNLGLRQYRLPEGETIELEEVAASTTSAEAEAERQKRLANMSLNVTIGKFQPLGEQQILEFKTPTGFVTGNTSTSTPGSPGGGSTAGPNILVPNTLLVNVKYNTAATAHRALLTAATTPLYSSSGLISLGIPLSASVRVLTNTVQTKLVDGYYAYRENNSAVLKVLRVAGGLVTEINIADPDKFNILPVEGAVIDPTRYTSDFLACFGFFDATQALPIYTTAGLMGANQPVYTQPNYGGRLLSGYYQYQVAPDVILVVYIHDSLIANPIIDCALNPNPGPSTQS